MKKLRKVDGRIYWSLAEAAKESGMSLNTLRQYVSIGRLQGYKFKNSTLVRGADVMRLAGRVYVVAGGRGAGKTSTAKGAFAEGVAEK